MKGAERGQGGRGGGGEGGSAGGFRAPRVRNFKLRSPRGVAPTLVHRRRKKIEDGEVDRGDGGGEEGGETCMARDRPRRRPSPGPTCRTS